MIADRRRIDLGEAIDQADFTATVWCHIGAVHPVDDTGEHESVGPRIKLIAVEQLKVELRPDADRLVRQLGSVPFYVSLEFLVERLSDRRDGRQRKQRGVIEWAA